MITLIFRKVQTKQLDRIVPATTFNGQLLFSNVSEYQRVAFPGLPRRHLYGKGFPVSGDAHI